MEYTLYSVLTVLIDAFFDDENEYGRLIEMMNESTSQESQMRFASHESTIESLAYAKVDLAIAKVDLAIANDKIEELEAEVKRLNDKLNGK